MTAGTLGAWPACVGPDPGWCSVDKKEFFAVYDYGQGALWAILRAESAEQIRRKYPGLEVFDGRPPRLDDATISAILRAGVRDIDDPPAGWLVDLAHVLK